MRKQRTVLKKIEDGMIKICQINVNMRKCVNIIERTLRFVTVGCIDSRMILPLIAVNTEA